MVVKPSTAKLTVHIWEQDTNEEEGLYMGRCVINVKDLVGAGTTREWYQLLQAKQTAKGPKGKKAGQIRLRVEYKQLKVRHSVSSVFVGL